MALVRFTPALQDQLLKTATDILDNAQKYGLVFHERLEMFRQLIFINSNRGNVKEGRLLMERAEQEVQTYQQHHDMSLLTTIRYLQCKLSLGWSLRVLDYWDEATLLITQANQTIQALPDAFYRISTLNFVGALSLDSGNYAEAKDIFQKAVNGYRDVLKVPPNVALVNNLGIAYYYTGDFATAREYLYQAKARIEQAGGNTWLTLMNLAEIDSAEGLIQQAIDKLDGIWDQLKTTPFSNFHVYILQSIVECYTKKGFIEKAEEYLEILKNAIGPSEEPLGWKTRYFFMKGLIDLCSENVGRAKKSLLEALRLNAKLNDFEIGQKIQLNLAAVLIQEYRLKKTEDAFLEAMAYVNCAIEDAIQLHFIPLWSEALQLRSSLLQTQDHQKEAINDLEKALEIGLKYKTLNEDQKVILEMELQQLKNKNPDKHTLWTKLQTRMKNLLGIHYTAAPAKKEEKEVLGVIIVTLESGLPLYNYYVSSKLKTDPALVSGLITAVQSFTQEVIGASKGMLQGIQHQNITIMLEASTKCTYVLFAEKDVPSLRKALLVFSRVVDSQYAQYFDKRLSEPLPTDDLNKLVQQVLLA